MLLLGLCLPSEMLVARLLVMLGRWDVQMLIEAEYLELPPCCKPVLPWLKNASDNHK